MYPLPRAILAAAMMWLGFAAAGTAAEPHAPGPAPAAGPHRSYAGEATQIPANGKPIALEVGKGTLIRLPRPASTVFVASPDIADVQIKSPELIYLSAKAPGQTVIYAVDSGDTVLLNAPVRVDFDLSQLRQSLERTVPGNAISVTQVDSSLAGR
jgi:pilus assembly protein CpaC